jgi:O-antigen ligase
MMNPSDTSHRQKFESFLIRYLFPVGWFLLLTGLFMLGSHGAYHRAFYCLLVAPCLLVLIVRPDLFRPLVRQPIFITVAIFCAYLCLSLIWLKNDEDLLKMLKIPLYVMVFMLGVGVFALRDARRFEQILHASALVAVFSAVCALLYHYYELFINSGNLRLSGYGVLYNPLLTAHVYGGFAIYWLGRWYISDNPWRAVHLISLCILGWLMVQTGSKTPFLGFALALLWLLVARKSRRGWYIVIAGVLLASTQFILSIKSNMWSGASYRPEIWTETLRQIALAPWFGHGYNAPITIPTLIGDFYDQHNIWLAVMYEGGVVGLALWAGIYISALRFSWRFRQNDLVLIASTWLVFGLGSGMTEGSSFLSRPKEHWFLIWIPLALLFASSVLQRERGSDGVPEKT